MTAQARLLGGRYQVGELLGYGGMAEVHRGRDLRLGRDVAIKMLRTDLARDATFQMRFRREAQNAASLNHPAIVSVYDTGEERAPSGETLPFIVMEFVSGRTLKEVLAVEGRLLPRRALEITADICAALEFSHRHGIIHRDIKPGNVMLTQNGQVKVMDFGIARALASGATTMTQTSAVIGTAQYLSPEQARGESVDARSDVYAAGCVLYELLCGHPPFVGDNPVSVAYQHVREDPRPASTINPDVTPDIDAVVLKALAKNPLNRYQSAAEMRADLLRAAAGRRVMATPVMSESETVAMAAAPTRQIGPATRQQMPARVGDPRARRRSPWVPAALAMLGVLAVVALVAGLLLYRDKTRRRPSTCRTW
jgi:serine/threonine-protein kinase